MCLTSEISGFVLHFSHISKHKIVMFVIKLLYLCVCFREQGGVKRRGYNSNLSSFSEMDDSEDGHTQNDITENSLNTIDITETTQVCLREMDMLS